MKLGVFLFAALTLYPCLAVQSRDQQGTFKVDFTSGDATQLDATRIFEAVDAAFAVTKRVGIPVGGYDFTQVRGSYTFGPQRRSAAPPPRGTAASMTGPCTS